MADLTARITEILTTHQDVDLGVEGERSWLAAFLAAAAEEHYRPRIETVEQLDALPFLTIVREVYRPSPGSGCDYGAVWERRTSGWQCLAGSVMPPGYSRPKLGCVVLWSPGAGE